ncbi:hypothetical protein Moror_4444 [Moniliophthora roreri MCA 2997]|uniref:Uncharacterized protein n=1 Tax=Moniliophthora roreri (strain MCA 2997) TaxID=1381753 RepID=V2XI14_MONRO|nr:hypothetical protein Moror_4444 [Moniliophthora roreri MCA 2997]
MVKIASISHTRSRRNNPFTPMRKLLLRSKRPCKTPYIGKRRRDLEATHDRPMDPVVPTPPFSLSIPNATSSSPFIPHPSQHVHYPSSDAPDPQTRVALQNDDDDEDAVVITTLDILPFCCHEDLVTMSRLELVSVACSLNSKLPAILQIDVSSSDIFIRNSIEVLVGIRKGAPMSPPPAPKANRSRERSLSFSGFSGVEDEDEDGGDLEQLDLFWRMSPLAKHGKRTCGSPFGTPSKLARLVEEDEDAVMGDVRQPKRRKLSDRHDDVEMENTPTTTRFYGRATYQDSPAIRKRAIASHSQELRREMNMMRIAAPFATTERPRYRTNSDILRFDEGRPSTPVRGIARHARTSSLCGTQGM